PFLVERGLTEFLVRQDVADADHLLHVEEQLCGGERIVLDVAGVIESPVLGFHAPAVEYFAGPGRRVLGVEIASHAADERAAFLENARPPARIERRVVDVADQRRNRLCSGHCKATCLWPGFVTSG